MGKNNLSLIVFKLILFCGFNNIKASQFQYFSGLQNDFGYLYLETTINKMYKSRPVGRAGLVCLDNDNIMVGTSEYLNRQKISYKTVKYNDLSKFEQNLFDYYRFDQNQIVTVIGLNQEFFGNINTNFIPVNGSMIVNKEVQYIVWTLDSSSNEPNQNPYMIGDKIYNYKLLDERNPLIQIASACVRNYAKTITYNYIYK